MSLSVLHSSAVSVTKKRTKHATNAIGTTGAILATLAATAAAMAPDPNTVASKVNGKSRNISCLFSCPSMIPIFNSKFSCAVCAIVHTKANPCAANRFPRRIDRGCGKQLHTGSASGYRRITAVGLAYQETKRPLVRSGARPERLAANKGQFSFADPVGSRAVKEGILWLLLSLDRLASNELSSP
jgi:hypothetical protein